MTLASGIQAEVIGFRARARTRKAIMLVSTIIDAEAAARTTMNARRNGRRSERLMVLPATAQLSSVLLYVHRDHKDYQGRGAQDVHLDFHTAPELCLEKVLFNVGLRP